MTTKKTTPREADDATVTVPLMIAPPGLTIKHSSDGVTGLSALVLKLECGHLLSGAVMGLDELFCLTMGAAVFAGVMTDADAVETLRLADVSGVDLNAKSMDDLRATVRRVAETLYVSQEALTRIAGDEAVRAMLGGLAQAAAEGVRN